MAGYSSVYQAYPVSHITGEGRAEIKKKKKNWGPGAKKEGEPGGREGGVTLSVSGNYKSFHGDKSDGCGRNASGYHVYPVSRTTGEERAECSKGGGLQPL